MSFPSHFSPALHLLSIHFWPGTLARRVQAELSIVDGHPSRFCSETIFHYSDTTTVWESTHCLLWPERYFTFGYFPLSIFIIGFERKFWLCNACCNVKHLLRLFQRSTISSSFSFPEKYFPTNMTKCQKPDKTKKEKHYSWKECKYMCI